MLIKIHYTIVFWKRADMNEKLQESAQYLRCFNNLEMESFSVTKRYLRK